MSVDALVGEQQDFVVVPGWDSGGYVLAFTDSYQNPGCAVLDVL